jgi:hypothetical protein
MTTSKEKNGCTGKKKMLVQEKIIPKCTNNVPTNAPGSERTVKFLNGS